MKCSDGTLLGGRVRYAQPVEGYRTGLEPVLLAACVPALPGERVLEAGTGAGAGLLCLAARVPGIVGVGLERDGAMADLAARNFAANGFGTLAAEAADLLCWRSAVPFDHAFANPPWHNADGALSPVPGRVDAKRAEAGLLAKWVGALSRALRPRGSLSLILPAASLAEAVLALTAAKCPEVTVLPLWPRAGTPAKLLVIKGIRLGRGASRLLPGLVLHDESGISAAANAILRSGQALSATQDGNEI